MTSRERMLAALNCQSPAAAVPCSLMLYKGLLSQSRDALDFIQRQLDLGLDAFVQLPARLPVVKSDTYNLHGLPVSFDPAVQVREWKEPVPVGERPILVKEYVTPAGTLRAEIKQDEEWPYGDHVPFLDDYVETRSRRFIVNGMDDLPALRYLLQPPTRDEALTYQAEAAPLLSFARQKGLLTLGGWGVGADLIGWVYGLERMMLAAYDQPEFLSALLELIAEWNQKRMRLVLESGVDVYIKRAWYENVNFWTPRMWRKYILPILKSDADLCHRYGAKFGYLITADAMPLLEGIGEAGVDVIQGVDPLKYDLAETARRIGGKVCLWGGVNGHLTVERGTVEEVVAETRQALDLLAPTGGFILSPVDNIRQDTPTSRANLAAMLAEWRRS